MPSAGDIIAVTDISTIVGVQLGCVAAPVVTSSNGTATSGTTETRDAVLGNYTFTVAAAQATFRYRAVLSGANVVVSGGASNDRYACRIRDGGAGTPTSASTLWGHDDTKIIALTVLSGDGWNVSPTFVPGAGTHTLSVFYVRLTGAGSGVLTPGGTREFYVECLGPH